MSLIILLCALIVTHIQGAENNPSNTTEPPVEELPPKEALTFLHPTIVRGPPHLGPREPLTPIQSRMDANVRHHPSGHKYYDEPYISKRRQRHPFLFGTTPPSLATPLRYPQRIPPSRRPPSEYYVRSPWVPSRARGALPISREKTHSSRRLGYEGEEVNRKGSKMKKKQGEYKSGSKIQPKGSLEAALQEMWEYKKRSYSTKMARSDFLNKAWVEYLAGGKFPSLYLPPLKPKRSRGRGGPPPHFRSSNIPPKPYLPNFIPPRNPSLRERGFQSSPPGPFAPPEEYAKRFSQRRNSPRRSLEWQKHGEPNREFQYPFPRDRRNRLVRSIQMVRPKIDSKYLKHKPFDFDSKSIIAATLPNDSNDSNNTNSKLTKTNNNNNSSNANYNTSNKPSSSIPADSKSPYDITIVSDSHDIIEAEILDDSSPVDSHIENRNEQMPLENGDNIKAYYIYDYEIIDEEKNDEISDDNDKDKIWELIQDDFFNEDENNSISRMGESERRIIRITNPVPSYTTSHFSVIRSPQNKNPNTSNTPTTFIKSSNSLRSSNPFHYSNPQLRVRRPTFSSSNKNPKRRRRPGNRNPINRLSFGSLPSLPSIPSIPSLSNLPGLPNLPNLPNILPSSNVKEGLGGTFQSISNALPGLDEAITVMSFLAFGVFVANLGINAFLNVTQSSSGRSDDYLDLLKDLQWIDDEYPLQDVHDVESEPFVVAQNDTTFDSFLQQLVFSVKSTYGQLRSVANENVPKVEKFIASLNEIDTLTKLSEGEEEQLEEEFLTSHLKGLNETCYRQLLCLTHKGVSDVIQEEKKLKLLPFWTFGIGFLKEGPSRVPELLENLMAELSGVIGKNCISVFPEDCSKDVAFREVLQKVNEEIHDLRQQKDKKRKSVYTEVDAHGINSEYGNEEVDLPSWLSAQGGEETVSSQTTPRSKWFHVEDADEGNKEIEHLKRSPNVFEGPDRFVIIDAGKRAEEGVATIRNKASVSRVMNSKRGR